VTVDDATRWALAARTGDDSAAAAFVRTTQAEVWRFVASLVDPASADDLTQETYLRAFRALPSFEGRSSARTWLFGIAKRACADHLRSVVRRRRLTGRLVDEAGAGDPVVEPDPAALFSAAELVRALAEPRRTAFALTQLLGLSYAEAADVEGCPVGTIRSRVARARDDLIGALSEVPATRTGAAPGPPVPRTAAPGPPVPRTAAPA
jgi:RNA polymerase sigma-70 factor, ECF subfamily